MLEQGQSVRSPPPEEEGAVETMCDELTTIPHSSSPGPLGESRWRKLGVKSSLGSREGWGKGVSRFDFNSHYPTPM